MKKVFYIYVMICIISINKSGSAPNRVVMHNAYLHRGTGRPVIHGRVFLVPCKK